MSKKKKKNRKSADPNKVIILITVLTQLIQAVVELITKLKE